MLTANTSKNHSNSVGSVYRNDVHNSKSANVFYITPDGKKLRSKRDIKLCIDDSLDINMFTFVLKPLGNDAEIIRNASLKGWRKFSEKFKVRIEVRSLLNVSFIASKLFSIF